MQFSTSTTISKQIKHRPLDVVVIGAGVVGMSIVRELSRYELRIAVLEKEEEPAFGVSKSNSGIIHPGTQNPPDSLKGKLCVQGNKLIRSLSLELGVDFKEVGELIVIFEPDEIPRLVELKREGELLGVPHLQIVDKPWLEKHEPNLSDKAYAALYAPTAGILSPYRLVYDLGENAKTNGVEILAEQKVMHIETCSTSNNTQNIFFDIHTCSHTFRTRYIVNAAGLYADEIARLIGIDDFTIKPRKGEEFILDKKKEHLANHLLFPLPSKKSKGILIIKTSDGNPMIGPTAKDCDDKEDLSTSDEGLRKVLRGAKKMIPSICESDIIAYFAGLRPVAGNDFIIRSEPKVPGCITVAGIQSPGLTAAPAIALMVIDLLQQSGMELKRKTDFLPARRKTPHLFDMSPSYTRELLKRDAGYGDIVCRCEVVSAKEVDDSINRGAKSLDGIKFRTRAGAGRCHGSFCTTRLMKILAGKTGKPITEVTKRGKGSEIVKAGRDD